VETHDPGHRVKSAGAAVQRSNPFWGAQLVVAAALLLDLSLPEKLTLGPTWMLPSVEGLLLLGLVIASPRPRVRHSILRRRIAIGMIALVSAVNVLSLVLLCHELIHGGIRPSGGRPLILAGSVLWITNVLLFGLWYWELDGGGPIARIMNPETTPDFLFPQMSDPRFAPEGWAPTLVDYMYVSFTNATAFSPTDAMPLTPLVKLLMSGQALTALVTVGLVVARAVNILS
jgi:hypothetical protein